MLKKHALYISASALLVSPSGLAHADQIVLKNGDTTSGTIREMSEHGGVQFQAAYGQTLYIPWQNVADIKKNAGNSIEVFPPYWNGPQGMETSATAVISAPDFKPLTSTQPITMASNDAVTIYSLDNGQPVYSANPVTLTPPAPAPAPRITPSVDAPSADVEIEEDKTGWLGADWQGRINAGANRQTGNSDTKAFTVDGEVKAKWNDIHRAYSKAEYNFEEDEGTTTEDNQSLDIGYDYFFKPKWFANTHAEWEMDDLSAIDLRSKYGVALGYQPYESDELNLSMRFGPNYLREEFENGDTEDSLAAAWALEYDQKVWEDTFQLFHNHQIDVPTDDTGAWLLESETGVRLPIKNGIVGTAEIDFDRDNAPAPGVKKDDTQYQLKLGYEW